MTPKPVESWGIVDRHGNLWPEATADKGVAMRACPRTRDNMNRVVRVVISVKEEK